MLKKYILAGIALISFSAAVLAESKIGFVNSQKILNDAPQAARAKKKIEKDFEKRDQELQRIAKQLQGMQETLDKNAVTMAESERRTKEREFGELNRDFQRKQREFREDLSQRQNEEMAAIFERVNKIIKQIAEAEKYDIIFQEAVYANPRIDITDKVIKALGDGNK
ncbi:MAG: OmpH family outer membrane protein [Sulfuritalea sp.]|uniref:OmpH family outer membrane protein n=1 Tax=Sulfuritalea sp. TaxID=2480090 RepID=UPI0027547714|nr:OmpH family outer membrane protein [Sulfuritalea sp.]MDP3515220.1 OmpH family outer membrane protein [Sulfuritalea sp.]